LPATALPSGTSQKQNPNLFDLIPGVGASMVVCLELAGWKNSGDSQW
jgi:hypothetical protein